MVMVFLIEPPRAPPVADHRFLALCGRAEVRDMVGLE